MNKNNNTLLNMDIKSALIKLSLPATLAMIVNALYNIIDTIFVGQCVGKLGIAGLTIAFPIQMLALGISSMFGMGAASIASRELGANENESSNKTVSTMVFYNSLVLVILSILGMLFIKPILILFGATEGIYPFAYEYMKIIFPGFILFGSSVALNNIARAEGKPNVAMISMMLGAILNIVLDYIFMKKMNMGIKGAALATVIAQASSLLYLSWYFKFGNSIFEITIKNIERDFKKIIEIISIGFSSFLTQAGTSLLAIVINKSMIYYGGSNADMAIAVYGIINKITAFLVMPEIGIRQGTQPLLGFAYGNKNYARVNETIKASLKFMFIYSSISYVVVMLFAEPIIMLFGKEEELIKMGSLVLRIVLAAVIIIPVQIQTSCVFQSVGRAIPALVISMLRQFICLIPLVIIVPYITGMGIMGIFISFPLADIISSVISYFMLKKEMKQYEMNMELETC